VGGVAAGPGQALNADVLPTDGGGRTTDPSRDANLLIIASVVPGTFLPLLTGWVLSGVGGDQKAVAYRSFWFVQAACQLVGVCFLLQLSHFREPGSAAGEGKGGQRPGEDGWPMGARLCDGICFRRREGLAAPLGGGGRVDAVGWAGHIQ
jgi:hypothetical protein